MPTLRWAPRSTYSSTGHHHNHLISSTLLEPTPNKTLATCFARAPTTGPTKLCPLLVLVSLSLTVGVGPRPPPLLSWALASPQATNSNQAAGCSINYLDENYQVLQPLSASQLEQWSSASSSSSNSNNSSNNNNLSIGLECQYITAQQLHRQFNRIKLTGLNVTSLIVRDSNLTTLSNLPQGVHELRKLVISNTSIDLEVLKEGSESLDQLQSLTISNEKISNIPQNFFQEMQSLKELHLENDEIASLDGVAFHNLDDSLEILNLRQNRFNRFPMAVKNLAQLAVLDLSDNEILVDTQENDLPEKLEQLLNLRELAMNRINCTCEFSSSPFFEWIARAHISGVRCFAPEKLKSIEVIVPQRDEFCARSSAASSAAAASSLGTSHLGNRWAATWMVAAQVVVLLYYSTACSNTIIEVQSSSKHCRRTPPPQAGDDHHK